MVKYVGVAKVNEISLTKTPCNPLARALVLRSAAGVSESSGEAAKSNPKLETDDMSIKNLQRIAGMGDVTKSYFMGLDEASATAFLEKSVADQDAEAAAAAKPAEKAAPAQPAAELPPAIAEAMKAMVATNEGLAAQVADLKKSLEDRDARDAFKTAASDAAYRGYPGGAEKVAEVLRSISVLSNEEQAPIIAAMKSTAAAALLTGHVVGFEADVSKGVAPADAQLKDMAKSMAKDQGIDYAIAYERVTEDPANAQLVARANGAVH